MAKGKSSSEKNKKSKKAGKAVTKRVSHALTTQADNVAVAAYFKAEKRGFEPGHEVEDWLEAESELA